MSAVQAGCLACASAVFLVSEHRLGPEPGGASNEVLCTLHFNPAVDATIRVDGVEDYDRERHIAAQDDSACERGRLHSFLEWK